MNSTLWHEVNATVKRFAAMAGLDDCSLDDRGTALFTFDDAPVSLLLDEDRGALLLLATLGRPQARAETYSWLLETNLFWGSTRGATLARDAAGGTIILQQPLPIARLQPEELEVALERFVSTAEQMRSQLAHWDAGPSPEDNGGDWDPLVHQMLRA